MWRRVAVASCVTVAGATGLVRLGHRAAADTHPVVVTSQPRTTPPPSSSPPAVVVRREDPDWQAQALAALREGWGYCVIRGGVPPDVLARLQREASSHASDAGAFSECQTLLDGARAARLIPAGPIGAAGAAAAAPGGRRGRDELEGTRPGQRCGRFFRQGSQGRFHYMPDPSTEFFQACMGGAAATTTAAGAGAGAGDGGGGAAVAGGGGGTDAGAAAAPLEAPGRSGRALPHGGDGGGAATAAPWQWWFPVVEQFILESEAAAAVQATTPDALYLSEAQLVVSVPGSEPQPWHADNPRGGLTLIAPLCRMSPELGPTQLLPNSTGLSARTHFRLVQLASPLLSLAVGWHARWRAWTSPSLAVIDASTGDGKEEFDAKGSGSSGQSSLFYAVAPVVEPGDIIVMDARMLHRGLPNLSGTVAPPAAAAAAAAAAEEEEEQEEEDSGEEEKAEGEAREDCATTTAAACPRPRPRPIFVMRYDLKQVRATGR